MRTDDPRRLLARKTQIETLEDRVVMSADPLGGLLGGSISHHSFAEEANEAAPAMGQISHHGAFTEIAHHATVDQEPDFWIRPGDQRDVETHLREIEQTLTSAHGQTGLTNVRNDYGFRGGGQTVAVIDSGIAWDHYALGGGFGANYRVVGGFDFTEGDVDPYDDGPEGSHGTHVAGIVGSSDSTHTGVAPDVDLVGLRVFRDDGAGFFSWVEQALDWVHDNRDAFDNPITAVNLSLGTEWNADSIPAWAMLEDEFSQLKADGIFISVSAGNSFTSYNTPGLSYPAASPHVVPVMSTDDSGLLSYFSQRHQRAIAAPGRSIVSTVPDYAAGDANTITDDFASFSGTSMAAPYVAGASVIVREAMEFNGYTNITQDTIFDHLVATADQVFDSSTGLTYDRLNLEAAIDALMPTDDYGSTAGSAHSLGSLSGESTLSGLIGKLDDVDYFSFTAAANGTVEFTASATHSLDVGWTGVGTVTGANGEIFTMDVVAGQSYTLGLSTTDGIGYYDIDILADSGFTFTDWGTVAFDQYNNIAGTGETWYRIAAGQNGYVTSQASFSNAAGNIDLALFNANMQQIASSNGAGNSERVDVLANSGDEFYLRVNGVNADIDFQLTNMVSLSGSTVSVTGTSGNDVLSFAVGTSFDVMLNGVDYSFNSAAVNTIQFDGGAGSDTISLSGGAGNETATLRAGNVTLTDGTYTATAANIENVSVDAGTGDDSAYLYDTAGNETLTADSDRVNLTGSNFSNEATNFNRAFIYASTGTDTATFNDTAGNDTFAAWSDRAVMLGTGYFNDARGFDSTLAIATTGTDRATFHDTAGDDTYNAYHDRVVMTGAGYNNEGRGFDSTYAYASTGNNEAYFYDTAGNDTYSAYGDKAIMQGSGYYNSVYDFGYTAAFSTTGTDKAYLYDTAGDDVYTGWSDRATMSGTGYLNEAHDFGYTAGLASTGYDQAIFHGSEGNDTFAGWSNRSVIQSSGYMNDARNVDYAVAYANGGYDRAYFHGTSGDDTYAAWGDRALMTGTGFFNDTNDFEYNVAFSNGGNDQATFYDTSGDDVYAAWSNRAVMLGSGYFNDVRNFATTYAHATDGYDRAIFHDSANDDDVYAEAWGAYITDGTYHNEGRGFDKFEVYDDFGGNDEAHIQAHTYLFQLIGDWG